MAKTLIAAAVTLWGAAILITKVIHLGPYATPQGGSYGAGQTVALMVASFMVVVGAYQLRRALLERDDHAGPKSPAFHPAPIDSTGESDGRSTPPPARRP